MEITYMVIVYVITLICGAITKAFIKTIPSDYIPLQNAIIGIISGLICYFIKLEPNLVQALVLCILSAFGAGGTYDLKKVGK